MRQIVKNLIIRLLAYIPTKLPDTVKTHQDWAGSIITLAGYPPSPSYRHAVATALLHFNGRVRVSHMELANHLRESICKQAAFDVIQQLNEQQKQEETAKRTMNGQPAQVQER